MCMQQIYEMKFAARENIPGDTSQKRGKFDIATLRKFANRRKPLTLRAPENSARKSHSPPIELVRAGPFSGLGQRRD